MELRRREVLDLGERLRAADTPDPADIDLLGEHLIRFDGAMQEVADGLRSLGLEPTTRLKTSGTIIDKLKRQPHLDLTSIRDLAGARVVRRMTLDEQDAVATQIMGLWPGAKYIDRRVEPSFGYRAVHIVPRLDGCSVEIQLRTLYQDTWAQVMETFGDAWGRDVRYGGAPSTPDVPFGGVNTRREAVGLWIEYGTALQRIADLENELAAYTSRGDGDDERARELQRVIHEDLGEARRTIHSLAAVFSDAGVQRER